MSAVVTTAVAVLSAVTAIASLFAYLYFVRRSDLVAAREEALALAEMRRQVIGELRGRMRSAEERRARAKASSERRVRGLQAALDRTRAQARKDAYQTQHFYAAALSDLANDLVTNLEKTPPDADAAASSLCAFEDEPIPLPMDVEGSRRPKQSDEHCETGAPDERSAPPAPVPRPRCDEQRRAVASMGVPDRHVPDRARTYGSRSIFVQRSSNGESRAIGTIADDFGARLSARSQTLSWPRRRRRSGAHRAADRTATDGVGALVIGGDYQGLGIVRSLGRLGVPVCVVDDEYSIARFSRHAEHSVRVRDLRDEGETVRALFEVGRRLGLKGWVLFPTRDETVAALSRHRDLLAGFFRVPTPAWDVVRWAWDKRNTYRLANELGIPAPRTWYPRDVDEIRAIEAQPPFVIKPAIKEHFLYATKDKAWRADSRGELERLFAKATTIVKPGEVMVQEFVPGDGRDQFAYCAFFRRGHAVGQMVARRGRQHPPDFGRSSTFVETADVPELETLSLRFLRAIDYYGLAELEYKRDAGGGGFKLLDVNARTWGYHSLGPSSGVDFPAMLFADQLGRPVESRRARVGIRWVHLTTDLPTAAVMLFQGRLDWRSYWRSLRGFDVEGTFTRDDPLPGLVELALIPYLALKRGF